MRGPKVAISRLFRGLLVLNALLAPFTLLLVVFLGIMGGAGPNSPGALVSFGIAAGFVYLLPLGALVWHAVFAKIVDGVFRISPWGLREVSRLGLLLAAVLFVVAGNVFVDNLYQFRRGEYLVSFYALALDLAGLAILYGTGGVPIPFLDRLLTRAT